MIPYPNEEQKAMSDAIENLLQHESNLKKEAKIKEEQKKLAALFPSCYEQKSGVELIE